MCASVGGIVQGSRHAHEQIIQLQQLQEVQLHFGEECQEEGVRTDVRVFP
jgi:hypothetical protein